MGFDVKDPNSEEFHEAFEKVRKAIQEFSEMSGGNGKYVVVMFDEVNNAGEAMIGSMIATNVDLEPEYLTAAYVSLERHIRKYGMECNCDECKAGRTLM